MEMTAIRTLFDRLTPKTIWIAGIAFCTLAASGFVALARSHPVADARVAEELSSRDEAESAAEDATAQGTGLRPVSKRGYRAWCPECGVIVSSRRIERSGNGGLDDAVDVGFAASTPGARVGANGATRKDYEFTVRLRDGALLTFREATERTLRTGSQVIVIGGARGPGD